MPKKLKHKSVIQKISPHIIGKFTGEGTSLLLICTAGMHGNEPAGVRALETIFSLLDREPLVNPGFQYKGRLLGLLGNSRAFEQGKRFISKDLNRQWTIENLHRISQSPLAELDSEDLEMRELLSIIQAEIEDCQPERIILLDLHTTSAGGGIFGIATDAPESIRIAVELHAPVITGMLRGIHGTTLHFFSKENFPLLQPGHQSPITNHQITAVAFEAGQHDDPLSVNRSIAAIINCMRTIGSVRREDVENRHDDLLIAYSKDLPKVAELVKVHSIAPADEFAMQPGYRNFQPVKRKELLARDKNGDILAPEEGLILMPLYQPQGSDGFFLVKEIAY